MNTLYFVDLFHIEGMQSDLLAALKRRKCSDEEKYQIFLLLASFGYDKLLELFAESKRFPAFLLNEMLFRILNQDNIDAYVDVYHELPKVWKLGILDVVRDKHLRSQKLQNLLEGLLEGDEAELRLRAIKTLATLGYMSSADIVTRLIDRQMSGDRWKGGQASGEKLMLARLMGSIRRECFIPYLETMVGDNVYMVRSEAAKSIKRFKNGGDILGTIAASHPDVYARNISKEWMERSLDYE